MSAAKLYTPELLALAVELAQYPHSELHTFQGEARSKTCGSTLTMALALDDDDRIADIGMRVRACAVGQAAAAIFARHCEGRREADLETALSSMASWLDGSGPLPDWPDLAMIEPAREYPGRHGAILLPWRAAVSALSSTPATS